METARAKLMFCSRFSASRSQMIETSYDQPRTFHPQQTERLVARSPINEIGIDLTSAVSRPRVAAQDEMT